MFAIGYDVYNKLNKKYHENCTQQITFES